MNSQFVRICLKGWFIHHKYLLRLEYVLHKDMQILLLIHKLYFLIFEFIYLVTFG